MARKRPLGVKLIAAYFFLASMVLMSAGAVGYLGPDLRVSDDEFISHLAPSTRQFGIFDSGFLLAPFLALIEIIKCLGIWFQQRWARLVILAEIYVYFGRGALGLLLLWENNRNSFSSITTSPYFVIGLVQRVIVLFYLIQPDVKRAFGIPEREAW